MLGGNLGSLLYGDVSVMLFKVTSTTEIFVENGCSDKFLGVYIKKFHVTYSEEG